jgi:hypothetical protein
VQDGEVTLLPQENIPKIVARVARVEDNTLRYRHQYVYLLQTHPKLRFLTAQQVGWRTLLLDDAFIYRGYLEHNLKYLAAIARVSTEDAASFAAFKKNLPTVLFDFEKVKVNGQRQLYSREIELEYQESQKSWLRQVAAGKARQQKGAAA